MRAPRFIEAGGRRYALAYTWGERCGNRIMLTIRGYWIRRRDRVLGFLLALYALIRAVAR